jgi:hypothetical protein
MQKKTILIFILITLLIPVFVIGGGDNRPVGARSAAMGNASVALSDLWSAFNNQAGLAYLETTNAGFYYENRYLLKELGYQAGAIAYPLKSGTLGLSFNHFGYSAYNESKIGLAFAKTFGKYLAFGLQLDYEMTRLAESYGSRNFVTFEAGMLANITPQLVLGAHIYNPFSAKLAEYNDERAPVIFRLGAAYTLSDRFTLVAETEKNIYTDASVNAGIEFKANNQIFLRGGISTGQTAFSFGAGFLFGNLMLDISSSYHNILGYSPQASVSYKF